MVSYAEAVKKPFQKKKKLMRERSARRARDAVEITKVKGEDEVYFYSKSRKCGGMWM